MQDVNHALANLRQSTGISTLDFDADGNLSLVFDDEIPVNLARIDEGTIELWTELETFTGANDLSTLRGVLEANHLGEGTGSARIALAPGKDIFILCERVAVGPLTDEQFSERIIDFAQYAAFWRSPEGARTALASPSATTEPLPASSLTIRA